MTSQRDRPYLLSVSELSDLVSRRANVEIAIRDLTNHDGVSVTYRWVTGKLTGDTDIPIGCIAIEIEKSDGYMRSAIIDEDLARRVIRIGAKGSSRGTKLGRLDGSVRAASTRYEDFDPRGGFIVRRAQGGAIITEESWSEYKDGYTDGYQDTLKLLYRDQGTQAQVSKS